MPLWPHLRNVRFVAEERVRRDLAGGSRPWPKLAGKRLAGEPLKVGLGVERLEVARAAVHEEVDDPLRLGREMRRFGRMRIDGHRCGACLDCSCCWSQDNAKAPNPPPASQRKARRDRAKGTDGMDCGVRMNPSAGKRADLQGGGMIAVTLKVS